MYLGLLFSILLLSTDAVDVNTEYGIVRGQTVPVDNGLDIVNVNTFNAVPFGKSTEGERRFRVRLHGVLFGTKLNLLRNI